MYFIKMEVTAAEALYNFGLEEPSIVPFLSEILQNAVMITSSERAGSLITLNRELYLTGLQNKLKRSLPEPTAGKLSDLTNTLFDEVAVLLELEATKHECIAMPYKLFKKERNTLFITRTK